MISYDDEISRGHSDGYAVLRAPMDGLVIEAAYRETMIHSTEAVAEMLARKECLGCRHNTSPMVDILRSTLVWVSYMIFSGFHDIKFICIMFSNLYVL